MLFELNRVKITGRGTCTPVILDPKSSAIAARRYLCEIDSESPYTNVSDPTWTRA